MDSYNIQKLETTLCNINSVITTDTNKISVNKYRNNNLIQSSYSHKSTDDKSHYCFKVNDIFHIQENRHIIDLYRMYNSISDIIVNDNISTDIKDMLTKTYDILCNIEQYKTKNKDKLYIQCARNVEDFCVLCSFENSARMVYYRTNLTDSNLLLSNDKREFEFNDSISNLLDIYMSSMYSMKSNYTPCVTHDNNTDEIYFSFYKFDSNEFTDISTELKNYIDINDLTVSDIDNFLISVSKNEENGKYQAKLKDVNIINVNKKINKIMNEYKFHNIDNLKSNIFHIDHAEVNNINNVFIFLMADIPNSISDIIEKYKK